MSTRCPHCGGVVDPEDRVYRWAGLEYSETARTLSQGDRSARMTQLESIIIAALFRANGRTLHRENLYQMCYGTRGERDTPEIKMLDVMVSKLRAKARVAGISLDIRAVWGEGWRLS